MISEETLSTLDACTKKISFAPWRAINGIVYDRLNNKVANFHAKNEAISVVLAMVNLPSLVDEVRLLRLKLDYAESRLSGLAFEDDQPLAAAGEEGERG